MKAKENVNLRDRDEAERGKSDLLAESLIEEESESPNDILVEEIRVPVRARQSAQQLATDKTVSDLHVGDTNVTPPTVNE